MADIRFNLMLGYLNIEGEWLQSQTNQAYSVRSFRNVKFQTMELYLVYGKP